MLNLEDQIGLKVLLRDDNNLEFDEGIEVEKISARKFSDLAMVVADESAQLSDEPAYLMYRNVRLATDEEVLRSNNIRFDLTVVPAAMIGEEFVKTSGHYHPTKPGADVAYPELYYVAAGQATYLMQKRDEVGNIVDVLLCRVRAGEAIVMPPGYGHVTVNELSETLVMANWVSDNFQSIYSDYENLRGASFYIAKSSGYGSVLKNPLYEAPEYSRVETNPVFINDLKEASIYSYKDKISYLDFLNNPENHADDLRKNRLFV